MCGIVGMFSVTGDAAVAESQLTAMRDCLIHRGPDDAGLFIHREGGMGIGLGHRRLSILDLSASGRQPMSTADGTLWIVFNGEIFNFQELRRLLERTGRYVFRSRTDTEVILYGIREWGLPGCLTRLRGMFAFAVFDKADGSLTLVRDPLGVKPLYYHLQSGPLVFASEIKALLALPGITKALNPVALHHYLTFANAPAPLTFFDGILKLEAGTYLRMDRHGCARSVRYWDPARFVPSGRPVDEQECVEELRRLLRQAVARRMVSDVPFGAFLSGGVDSSLNVALMAELMEKPVETFSIGIAGDAANEFEHARRVARHFGTRHHEVEINDEDFLACLPRMAYAQDEPLADPVCVPLYYLSKLARESGTPVIQVGEGSDEIFAGYKTYHLFQAFERNGYGPYRLLPHPLRRLIYGLAKGHMPPEQEDVLRRACEGEPFFLGNAIAFWDSEKPRLLKRPLEGARTSGGYIGNLAETLSISDPLARMIQVELKNRLPELLLMRVDKMSMAHSIETRVPFLDEDLVAFALTIPSALKHRGGEAKYILKRAAEGIVPQEIIYRKKWGFCGSATSMLTERLASFAHDAIMDSPLVAERFNRGYIETIFHNHRAQKRFNSFKIWNLLNLALWHACWFEGGNPLDSDIPPRYETVAGTKS